MLCLTRLTGEHIVIGQNIRVVVQAVHGRRVTLGIEAPPEVPIRRAELPPQRPVPPRSTAWRETRAAR